MAASLASYLEISFQALPPLLQDFRHPVGDTPGWEVWDSASLLDLWGLGESREAAWTSKELQDPPGPRPVLLLGRGKLLLLAVDAECQRGTGRRGALSYDPKTSQLSAESVGSAASRVHFCALGVGNLWPVGQSRPTRGQIWPTKPLPQTTPTCQSANVAGR